MKNKPKVAIITRHSVVNYGSFLQAYATEHVLRRLGCNPVTIDYIRRDETVNGATRRYSEGKSPLHKLYRSLVWRGLYARQVHHFRSMQEHYLTLSKGVDETTIKGSLDGYDVYLTGSDQVWNTMGDGKIDAAYFWADLPEECRRISYAASFGKGDVDPSDASRMREWLSRFEDLSVREESGMKLVEQFGLRAEHVLDPTLLLDEDSWSKLVNIRRPSVRGDFALVYNLHRDPAMLAYIEEQLKGSGLQIISICPSFRPRVGKDIYLPSMSDFIWLFKHATCVFTDSFHGTAFCINLKIPFVATYPRENAARNSSLLAQFGLEERKSGIIPDRGWHKQIDWAPVHEKLEAERACSLAWLGRALADDER